MQPNKLLLKIIFVITDVLISLKILRYLLIFKIFKSSSCANTYLNNEMRIGIVGKLQLEKSSGHILAEQTWYLDLLERASTKQKMRKLFSILSLNLALFISLEATEMEENTDI